MVVLMVAKQPAVQPKARVASKSPSRTIEVKAMLRAVMEHQPFGDKTQAEKTAAWARIAEAVWEGDAPKFDVKAVFAKLMAFPSSDQRNFVGWDEEMYQLRARLVEAYGNRSTPVTAEKRAARPQAETNGTQSGAAEPGHANSEDREVSTPGVPLGGDGERYPKRIRVRRVMFTDDDEEGDALREDEGDEGALHGKEDDASSDGEEESLSGDQDDEDEWAGEINGAGDVVCDWQLAQAIVKFGPHKVDDTDAAWGSTIAWLREKAYPRKLTVKALKRQFGILLNVLAMPGQSEDPKVAELRATLVSYCKSADHSTLTMRRFVQSSSVMPSEPPIGGPRRSARAQRHTDAPEPPQAAHADRESEPQTRRPARPTVARPAHAASEWSGDHQREIVKRALDSLDAMEHNRQEATKALIYILQTCRSDPPSDVRR